MHATIGMVCRIGTEVETRKVGADGTLSMSKARVVTKRRTKRGGEWIDNDSWFTLVAFGREAEKMEKASKGDLCFVSGEPYVDEWETSEGEIRATMEVKVAQFAVLPKSKTRESGYPSPEIDQDIPF